MLSLNEIIDRALEISKPKIELDVHALSISLALQTAFVNSDPMRLVQALSNILNGAAKFTPRRGMISVRESTEGDMAMSTVKDKGVGISK